MSLHKLTRTASQIAARTILQQNRNSFVRFYSEQSKPRSNIGILRLGFRGVIIGAALGTGYSGYTYFTKKRTETHIPVKERDGPIFIKEIPDTVKISRNVINPKDDSGLELILFQFQTCPFCCKVRSFLDYSGFSYKVVEVDSVFRKSIKWSPYKKVPILVAKTKDNRLIQLNDSSMIISALTSFLFNKEQDIAELVKFYPNIDYDDEKGERKTDIMNKYFLMFQRKIPKEFTKESIEEERKWRSWADSHLVHLISPNVYRTKDEALETFEWFSDVGEWKENFPAWERNMMVYVGATAMWAIAKRLKKRHNLRDDVRCDLYDACDKWTKELSKKKTPFMGGKKPNLADLSVFGVLNSMEGCQAFKDCLDNTNIGSWFYAVKMLVDQNRGVRENSL